MARERMTYLICNSCGGELKEISVKECQCTYCKRIYPKEVAEDSEKMLRQILRDAKIEKVSNIRRLLWDSMNEKNINSRKIVKYAREIKKYLPDDYFANFCEIANSGSDKEVNDFLNNTTEQQMREYADVVLEFMIKSAKTSNLNAISLYIERAYKGDAYKYDKYITKFEVEAQKIKKGVYEESLTRDVFIAYSSEDIKEVIELCDYLEKNNISCFMALRNLRHGRDAVDRYDEALKTAIDNCKTVVFVSSTNSRDLACDAFKKELSYIKAKDLESAPSEYRRTADYDKLPAEYMKPRVEYLIENYRGEVVESAIKEFFHGLEWCKSKEAVAKRITKYLTEIRIKPVQKNSINDKNNKIQVLLKQAMDCYNNNNYTKAVELLKKAADMGSMIACQNIGVLYYNGEGLQQNYEEAVKWLRKPAEANIARAQYHLGNCYLRGNGVKQDYTMALSWLLKAAKQNDVLALTCLGDCYSNGTGVNVNGEEAVKWYRRAVEQGYAEAQFKLGACYYNGFGVKKNSNEAFKLLQKAADQGYIEANRGLGLLLIESGNANNYAEAIKFLRKAAEQGDAESQKALGICYYGGKVIKQNIQEGLKWLRKAAAQNDNYAQKFLGKIYYDGTDVEQNYEEAAKFFLMSALQGDMEAQSNLGYMYYTGQGVDLNYSEAVKWLSKAAEQGSADAQYQLAGCYYCGQGVSVDIEKSKKLMTMAAKQGHSAAQQLLQMLYNF